jgi:DNA polymerase-1
MTALLVDYINLAMVAIHAMNRPGQSILSADGVNTGALLVFVNSLSRYVREEAPEKVAVLWDGGRSSYRLAIDPNYKAHRVEMSEADDEGKQTTFGLAKEFLSLAGFHHVERPGVEADDLIAYYWRHHRPFADKLVILSSDKDFLQLLVDDECEQVRLSSAGTATDRWTATRVREEMGCEPDALRYAMALAGDTSDNVPGVPRFGMKTAIKALKKWGGDLDSVVRYDPRVVEHVERVWTNLSLVDLIGTPNSRLALPPIPTFAPTGLSSTMFPELLSFLSQYQMKSVTSRLYDGTLWKEVKQNG